MKRTFLVCCVLTCVNMLLAQQNAVRFAANSLPASAKSYFRLGDQVLAIKKQGNHAGQPFVFVSLHHNEVTATSAALDYIEKNGGQLISLESNNQRTIEFELVNKKYLMDPNQIFTKRGRVNTLSTGPYNSAVAIEIQRLSQFILDEIPEDKIIVSMHNHENAEWGLTRFAEGRWKRNAKALYLNPDLDEDDYFVTTDEYVFERLKEKKWNVMLYNTRKGRDDGSMIVYYGRLNKMYIDVVTEFGHYEQQKKMVEALTEILK